MDLVNRNAVRPGLFQRINRYIQKNGIGSFPARVWQGSKIRPSYNAFFIFSFPIHPEMSTPPRPEGIQVERLSANDEEALQNMATVASEGMTDALKVYHQRMPGGELCYTVRVDGKLAAFVWLAMRESVSSNLGSRFLLKPDEVYLYDTFTLPEYRGRGYCAYLTAVACQEVSKEYGKKAEIVLIRHNNHASLRAHHKLGDVKRLGMIGALRLLGCRFNFCWPPAIRSRYRDPGFDSVQKKL